MPDIPPCVQTSELLLGDNDTSPCSRARCKFICDRTPQSPNQRPCAGQYRPARAIASWNTRLQEHSLKFADAMAPVRTIRITRTPVPENQWPAEPVEVECVPPCCSFARHRRPVNDFQGEPAVNFRDNNTRGFRRARGSNRVFELG